MAVSGRERNTATSRVAIARSLQSGAVPGRPLPAAPDRGDLRADRALPRPATEPGEPALGRRDHPDRKRVAAREKGFVRTEGKEYVVRDGDTIEFKHG